MASETLVSHEIQQGQAVLDAIDRAGLHVRTAFWLYADESWRLVLATPLVDDEGPLPAYRRIQQALAKFGTADVVPLNRIQVISVRDPLIRAVKQVVHVPRTSRSPTRYTRNVVNGILVEDAYIYRST